MSIIQQSLRIYIEHIRLRSELPVDQVHRRLLETVPCLDSSLLEMLERGDVEAVERERREGPPLWLFGVRDLGSLLNIEGRTERAYQYEIGNPLTAESMVRFNLEAGLYAPVRILLYASDGGCLFAYDKPSSVFGQFNDDRIRTTSEGLDAKIFRALNIAMGRLS
jgi:hypothetical protein